MLNTIFSKVAIGEYFKLPTDDSVFVKKDSFEGVRIGEDGRRIETVEAEVEFDKLEDVCVLDLESEWPTIDYKPAIEGWNWDYIAEQVKKNIFQDRDGDGTQVFGKCWVGTTINVMPSGKFYALWTSNQTIEDVNRDKQFGEALEEVVEAHGFFVDWNDSNDLFISKAFTWEEVARAAGYQVGDDNEAKGPTYYWVNPAEAEEGRCLYETEEEAWKDCCLTNRLVQE